MPAAEEKEDEDEESGEEERTSENKSQRSYLQFLREPLAPSANAAPTASWLPSASPNAGAAEAKEKTCLPVCFVWFCY